MYYSIMWRKMSRERSKYVLIGKELCLPKNARKKRKTEKTKIFFKKGLTNAFCFGIITKSRDAGMAQSVEHVIGNDEVISSILITSSKVKDRRTYVLRSFWLYFTEHYFFRRGICVSAYRVAGKNVLLKKLEG